MTSLVDSDASTVQIDKLTGDVRVDGALMLRAIVREGLIWLQFCDRDRLRSNARRPQTRYIEVRLKAFLERLNSELGGEDGNTC